MPSLVGSVSLISLIVIVILSGLLVVLEQAKTAATPDPVRIKRDDE